MICGILLLMAACPALGESSGYVRLHVVAASDSPRAQALKLEVRDAVLDCARVLLAGAESADEAWRAVLDHRPIFEAAARLRALAGGYLGPVYCRTGVFAFPARRYGDTWVPPGRYRALRVVIGPGRGHNWWCVLYPSLCYPEGVDPEDPGFYSTLWRWMRGLIGGDAA